MCINHQWFSSTFIVVKCFTLQDVLEQFEPWGIVKVEWVMIDRNNTPTITSEGVWTPQLEYIDEIS
jgi:hypothetical protein